MRVLFVGDIVGKPGRKAVARLLPDLISEQGVDLVIANGENAAGGYGLTGQVIEELVHLGIDCITSGNHLWDRREIVSLLDTEERVLRPANYPPGTPGRGWGIFTGRSGIRVGVVNLMGRVFMRDLDCPFRTADQVLEKLTGSVQLTIVDFHAEATSEKMAMGWYLDGRVSAVVGTHTHIQTCDAQILSRGTGYITDVGMTGPFDSVIGMKKELALRRFLTQLPTRFEVASSDVRLNGLLLSLSEETGLAERVELLDIALSS
ncbi:metallophosphoesterase [candidate division TA06 bacterium SM1_40]|uniref:Metallophosphoesterase n=2 Tax=Bacteria division TA06 TaxID=1156500 RepID=A0A0S8JMI7_UNCT6|nr:MAG: metallophosphoesterase [candidate division TA06 bacterium SM23_40]KPL10044.1 MAG: metallophosphoesterase [candidate division TA06 bacterium SM1_40]